MRKYLNIIRTPWTTAINGITTNDLNGILSLKNMSCTPISKEKKVFFIVENQISRTYSSISYFGVSRNNSSSNVVRGGRDFS
jgi:hypothetical protein